LDRDPDSAKRLDPDLGPDSSNPDSENTQIPAVPKAKKICLRNPFFCEETSWNNIFVPMQLLSPTSRKPGQYIIFLNKEKGYYGIIFVASGSAPKCHGSPTLIFPNTDFDM
jgi:hypothetical protein